MGGRGEERARQRGTGSGIRQQQRCEKLFRFRHHLNRRTSFSRLTRTYMLCSRGRHAGQNVRGRQRVSRVGGNPAPCLQRPAHRSGDPPCGRAAARPAGRRYKKERDGDQQSAGWCGLWELSAGRSGTIDGRTVTIVSAGSCPSGFGIQQPAFARARPCSTPKTSPAVALRRFLAPASSAQALNSQLALPASHTRPSIALFELTALPAPF